MTIYGARYCWCWAHCRAYRQGLCRRTHQQLQLYTLKCVWKLEWKWLSELRYMEEMWERGLLWRATKMFHYMVLDFIAKCDCSAQRVTDKKYQWEELCPPHSWNIDNKLLANSWNNLLVQLLERISPSYVYHVAAGCDWRFWALLSELQYLSAGSVDQM